MVWDAVNGVVIYPTVVLADYLAFTNQDVNRVEDTAAQQRYLDTAIAAVQNCLRNPLTRPVPAAIYTSVVLEVAFGISRRKDNGTVQRQDYNSGAIYPVRGPKDPLTYSLPLLRPYLVRGGLFA